MKAAVRDAVAWLLEFEPVWAAFVGICVRLQSSETVQYYFRIMLFLKCEAAMADIKVMLERENREFKVMSGPFEGMLAIGDACGSSMPPKVLGTYERELHAEFPKNRQYDRVYNIGSAEGYYAVGLLVSGCTSQVHCFDLSDEAHRLCRSLAVVNGIEQGIVQHGGCEREDVMAFDASAPTLVLCDCEGHEAQLFDRDSAGHLAGADVIIEVHEHLGASLADLESAFSETHDVHVIAALDDWARAVYPLPGSLKGLPLATRILLTAERRAPMHWLVARSRVTA